VTQKKIRYRIGKAGQLALQWIAILELERRRISRNLHDGTAQLLSAAEIKLTALTARYTDANFQTDLQEISGLLKRVSQQIRTLEFELNPPVLDQYGLVAALEWLSGDMQQNYDLTVKLLDDGAEKPLSKAEGSIMFRAVRELLINVAKHAQVSQAEVALRRENSALIVEIEDAGVGFTASEAFGPAAQTMGLPSVQDQLKYIGGKLKIDSVPGNGTKVTLSLPLEMQFREWTKPTWRFV
jgi:two-component system, chemotaxis family, CheB/CheR fusion protein